MTRGSQLAQGESLEVFSTKLRPHTKDTLGDIVQVMKLSRGREFSQRLLIEEMLAVWSAENPGTMKQVAQLRGLFVPEDPNQVTLQVDFAAKEKEVMDSLAAGAKEQAAATAVEPAAPAADPHAGMVQVIRYVGRDDLHLYDPNRTNSTGCNLAGQLDMDSLSWAKPEEVKCGKCRYCNKKVFAHLNKE